MVLLSPSTESQEQSMHQRVIINTLMQVFTSIHLSLMELPQKDRV